jgi:L-ascorbate metabolism protein UlaG (beta-lactamase superfamily)
MILRYYGHSLFTMTLQSGLVLLTDPYGSFCRYPRRALHADVVTISHHHYDHDGMDSVLGDPLVIDEAGEYRPADGVLITGIRTFHDSHEGTRRGRNVVFVMEAEGLRIVHLGDLGHLPDERQKAAIGKPDVLLIPVGGTYTIDAQRAFEVVELLKPGIAIPMHYQTRFSMDLGVAGPAEFLQLMGACTEPQMELALGRDTLDGVAKLVMMDIQE